MMDCINALWLMDHLTFLAYVSEMSILHFVNVSSLNFLQQSFPASVSGCVCLHRVPVPGMETHIPVLFLDLSGMLSPFLLLELKCSKNHLRF